AVSAAEGAVVCAGGRDTSSERGASSGATEAAQTNRGGQKDIHTHTHTHTLSHTHTHTHTHTHIHTHTLIVSVFGKLCKWTARVCECICVCVRACVDVCVYVSQ